MAGRSSKSDNRGNNFFGFLASGKGRQYHTSRDAAIFTPKSGITASGGVVSEFTSGPAIYRAHIFTSSGTFDVTALGDFGDTVDALLVGGGGGGAKYGGGGGGGAVVHVETKPISTGPNTIVIASGGVGARADGSGPSPIPAAADGGSTTFLGYTATGGGGGGGYNNQPARAGANGGGQGAYLGPPTYAGVAGVAPTQPTPLSPFSTVYAGNTGGMFGTSSGPWGIYPSGGGAGAGGNGETQPISSTVAGAGGVGKQINIIPSPPSINSGAGYHWAGGGGGSVYNLSTGNGGDGGVGGGGGGGDTGAGGAGFSSGETSPSPLGDGGNGGESTGGGGGGAVYEPSGNVAISGNGGSGIVVIRYQIGSTSTAKASGGSISFYGGKTIHTFTSTGNFVTPGSFSETVEYVAIGGGGAGGGANAAGGGNNGAGGGGAGGYTTASVSVSGPKTSVVTIGAGGAALETLNTAHQPGNNTTITNFPGTITAGYGAGGQFANAGPTAAAPLGSGGGSGAGAGNTGSGPQGNDGGAAASSSPYSGGGGGGAGGVGQDRGTYGGSGGIGVRLPATFRDPTQAPASVDGGGLGAIGPGPSDTNTFWVAGGGGGGSYPGAPGGSGGGAPTPDVRYAGGGSANRGNHPSYTPQVQQFGVANTGGGGGGVSPFGGPTQTQQEGRGGSGGSGLVLIAYPT